MVIWSFGITAVGIPTKAVAHNLDQILRPDGFIQVLRCSRIHGFQVCIHLTISGENDDRDFVSTAANRL